MTTIKKEKLTVHPMEELFDIEPGTTVAEYTEYVPDVVVSMGNYDKKDDEIETKLEEIYSVAMGTVSDISDQIDRVEGKYKARVGEVAATMLNVALGAVREKSQLKQHKDKLAATMSTPDAPHTVNNTLVVTDRNELVRMLMKQAEAKKL